MLRFGEQGAALARPGGETRADMPVPRRRTDRSSSSGGVFALPSADGRGGEFGQDGVGDVVVDRVAVLGEGGAELCVRGVVVTVGHRRQPQGAAGADRDGAAFQRIDEGQGLLGLPACVGRLTEQRHCCRLERSCARLGVVQSGLRGHHRDLGGHRAGLGPAALFQIGPADGAAQTGR
ncbi:hypothetical protein LV779_23675 [Streptomyces thinghirensis]|nr:hypothetical protein [Streptomyces thinghirensis]